MAINLPVPAVKKRMLRIASGCATREAFVAVFSRFCDRESIFIATRTPKARGEELNFAITLSSGQPLIVGSGEVEESWTDGSGAFGRPGMKIRFAEVSESGRLLIDELAAVVSDGAATDAAASDGQGDPDADASAKRTASPPPVPSAPASKRSPLPKHSAPSPARPPSSSIVNTTLKLPPLTSRLVPPVAPVKATAGATSGAKAETSGKVPAVPSKVLPARTMLGLPALPRPPMHVVGKSTSGKAKPAQTPAPPRVAPTPAASTPAAADSSVQPSSEPGTADAAAVEGAFGPPPSGPRSQVALVPAGAGDEKGRETDGSAQDVEVVLPPSPMAAAGGSEVPESSGIDTGWEDATGTFQDTRVRGSNFVLPANPFDSLDADSLDSFVECTIYEDNGEFGEGEPTSPNFPEDWDPDLEVPSLPGLEAPPLGSELGLRMKASPDDEGRAVSPSAPSGGAVVAVPRAAYAVHAAPDYAEHTDHGLLAARKQQRRNTIIGVTVCGAVCLLMGYGLGRSGTSQLEGAAEASGLAIPDAKAGETRIPGTAASPSEVAASPKPAETGAANPLGAVDRDSEDAPAGAPPPSAAASDDVGRGPDDLAADEHPQDSTGTAGAGTGDIEPALDGVGGSLARRDLPTSVRPVETAEIEEAPSSPPSTSGALCAVSFVTDPDGARVIFGGVDLGATPLRTEIACDASEITLRHPRYQEVTQPLSLSTTEPASVSVELERPTYRLKVVTSPAGAAVSVNGRSAGKSPVSLQVRGFEKARVSVSMPGYKSWSDRVYVRKPTTHVSARLERASSSRRSHR